MSLDNYKKWFESYTHNLISSNPNEAENYELKVEHTFRVVQNIVELSELMKLDSRDKEIAQIIGLFHDLGRFVQFSKFGTFSEAKTGSHATLSVEKLKTENILTGLSEEEVEIIYQAIEYHNHLALPVMSNETIYTLGTILRDADKLDAFYLSTSNDSRSYSFDELSNEALYSEEIISSILNSKQADFREIKYKYDRDLSVIALLFNLEFNEAFQIVKANNYIERMFDAIPSDERLMSAKGHCMKYIDAKIR